MSGLFRKLDELLAAAGRWTSRGAPALENWQFAAFALPCVVMCLALGVFVFPQYLREYVNVRGNDLNTGVTLPLPQKQWRILYEDPELAPESNCATDAKCPGNLNNDSLWQKGESRGKADVQHHFHTLGQMRGKTIWIGTKISAATLARARALHLHRILIGFISGTYEIWWRGKKIGQGNWATERDPTVVNFSPEDLDSAGDEKLAIRIALDVNAAFPDNLNWDQGLGFATEADVQYYQRILELLYKELNSISLGFNLAMALFFSLFWLFDIKKQEMVVFAAYALMHGLVQSAMTPVVWHGMGAQVQYALAFITTFYEPIFLMFVGLSIARLRSLPILILALALLLAPWSIFVLDLPSFDLIDFANPVAGIILAPLCYFVAATACLFQARLLARDKHQELEDPGRIRKLHVACALLTLMCLAHAYGTYFATDVRIVNSLLLVGLAVTIVHNYRKEELAVRQAPLSKYHQMTTPPVSVPCVMISVELKNSEGLYRFGAEKGVGSAHVQEIINLFRNSAANDSGEVIQSAGDSLTFFFELNHSPAVLISAIETVTKLNILLVDHLREAANKQDGKYPTELRLRAAMEIGQIKPVWLAVDGRQLPGWAPAANSTIFADLARLLAVESQVGDPAESMLVVNEVLATQIHDAAGTLKWHVRAREVAAKSGQIMVVSALRLRAKRLPSAKPVAS